MDAANDRRRARAMSADETERWFTWARDTLSALTLCLAPMRYLNYLDADAVDPAAWPTD